MAIQSLHEMIRNLSAYIKSLEVLCECGVTLSKNFERLLSQHTGGGSNVAGASSSTSGTLDSDMLSQSVATWELAHKVAHADATSLIDELLPLLQDTIHGVMKDPAVIQSSATYEVFRSCFSAFFQIQWRFCQLYLSCASSQAGSHGGGPLRSPETHLARSPTLASFTSSSMSGDRRESTESCMSAFSLPRSSFSGMSSISSRSSSPSPGMGHYHGHGGHYGFGGRSRTSSIFESSASVKFTPSQPPSPLMPYGGEGGFQPNLFRRWSAYSNVSAGTAGSGHSSGGGSGVGSSISGMGSYGSSGGNGASLLSSPMSYGYAGYQAAGGFSRRWSVPASSSISQHSSGGESSKKSESPDLDYGLINAINLLSTKPPTPTNLITTLEESHGEYGELESEEPQTTALWPPSDTMPGVVLTTCGTDPDAPAGTALEALPASSLHHHQSSLRVPFTGGMDPTYGLVPIPPCPQLGAPGIGRLGVSGTGAGGLTAPSGAGALGPPAAAAAGSSLFSSQLSRSTGTSGEYSLFGNTPSTTSGP